MSGNIARAIFGVAGILLVSRLLGFVREMIIADKFGTSAGYDLYLIAVMFPALVYGIVNFAGIYLFVPYLSDKAGVTETSDRRTDWSRVWPAVNLLVIVSLALTILIVLLAPFILRLWSRDYLSDEFHQIVFYARITAVMIMLGATEAFMRAFLNVKKIFAYPAAGYIVYNVACIAGILIFYQTLGIGSIAVGLLGGLFVQNLFLALWILRYRPWRQYRMSFLDSASRTLLSTAAVLILIELVNRSYFLIDRFVAARFGEGVISALNYSQVLIQLPDSIIGFAIGAVVFPLFSESSDPAKYQRFGRVYDKAITSALLLAVPIAAFFFVHAGEIVFVLLARGEFDATSVELTQNVLRPFAPSIIALFAVSTSIRACYALRLSRYVLAFAASVFLIKAIGTFILAGLFGYAGITLATTTAHVGFALFMVSLILKRVTSINKGKFVATQAKLILAGLISGALLSAASNLVGAGWTYASQLYILGKLVLSGALCIILYMLTLYLLGMKSLVRELLAGKLRSTEVGSA